MVATQAKTGKASKASGKPPVAAKAAPNGKATEGKKKEASTAVIPVLKPGAISVDIGPRVISGFMQVADTEAEANKLFAGAASKRYDMLAQLTAGIVKAAKADKTIDLGAYFSKDNKRVNAENDKLGIALGFRSVVTIGEGDSAKQRVVLAPAVAKLFPGGSDTKGTAEAKRKATVMSNFLHTFKKCAQAAEGIIAKDIKMTVDKDSGTLRLSGPAVKTTFGENSVLLNEKQTVGEGDKAKKLAAKPSFTAVANLGAQEHGVVMKVRKDSRAQAVDPVLSFVSVCKALTEAIGKLGDKPDSRQTEALRTVQNAIDQWGGLES
jgi:hypothetical protein